MNIVMIVPNVVRRYWASFPEVRNNGYRYFNYDNRVVEERVYRGDARDPYQGPDDFCDEQYDALVNAARSAVDPMVARYSMDVACREAMDYAIWSYQSGKFASKVNASRYNVLLGALKQSFNIAQGKDENYYRTTSS